MEANAGTPQVPHKGHGWQRKHTRFKMQAPQEKKRNFYDLCQALYFF
jgi:hypothetical protein